MLAGTTCLASRLTSRKLSPQEAKAKKLGIIISTVLLNLIVNIFFMKLDIVKSLPETRWRKSVAHKIRHRGNLGLYRAYLPATGFRGCGRTHTASYCRSASGLVAALKAKN